jgi:hypothetical protein
MSCRAPFIDGRHKNGDPLIDVYTYLKMNVYVHAKHMNTCIHKTFMNMYVLYTYYIHMHLFIYTSILDLNTFVVKSHGSTQIYVCVYDRFILKKI